MSFTVPPGQVTGFVGPNGAGKSTTMRVILGLDAPDPGRALIGGQPYRSLRHPLNHVGALLDAAALQPSRSARNHLLWLAHSQGLGTKRVNAVIEQAGLGSAAKRKAGGYSLGMRQRLGIAAAMLGDPPVLMLDEPFNGLDPEGIVWIRGCLRSLAAEGRAVLVSSHLMSELQGNADHLVVVGRGQVIADTSVAELLTAASRDRVTLRTTALSEAMTVLTAGAHRGRHRTGHAHDLRTGRPSASRRCSARTRSRSPSWPPTAPHSKRPTWNSPGTRPNSVPSLPGRSHDDRHDHALPVQPADRPRRLRPVAAVGVDQVQDGARLGHRHVRRGPGHRAGPDSAGRHRAATTRMTSSTGSAR